MIILVILRRGVSRGHQRKLDVTAKSTTVVRLAPDLSVMKAPSNSTQLSSLPKNAVTLLHTHNRFTAGLEYVRVHPGQQVPER